MKLGKDWKKGETVYTLPLYLVREVAHDIDNIEDLLLEVRRELVRRRARYPAAGETYLAAGDVKLVPDASYAETPREALGEMLAEWRGRIEEHTATVELFERLLAAPSPATEPE